MSTPAVHCIIVTFRRDPGFRKTLELALSQSRQPARIIVVDNGQSDDVARTVAACSPSARVDYIRAPENLGPAGGTALAMRSILTEAGDDDWITRLDDDLTEMDSDVFEVLLDFGQRMVANDPATAAVGAVGSRYDRRKNRLIRIDDAEIARGPVPVDYVPTNVFPMYRVRVVRAAGTLDERLFYGFSEVEYGLRLRAAGYSLYACPELWQRLGRRTAATAGPTLTLQEPDWRRYYALRNQIWMLHESGDRYVAFRVGIVRCILKPLASLCLHPHLARRHLGLGVRAFRDGWTGRLGRTIDPEEWT
jgi:glycosyltransferase involved in cell wall biosynthesis